MSSSKLPWSMASSRHYVQLLSIASLLVIALCAERTRPDAHQARFSRQHGALSRGSQPHACEESSCYPATGNLLIGREDKLSASSTCGLYGVETYCIVSHLKEKTKCFRCDSTKKGTKDYHGIENIVSRIGKKRKNTWWQSQNGVQSVSIRLDLEAEFHFTHLIITFKTFRPAAMLIERSHDNGHTWRVYQYFAYDCADAFPGVPVGPRRNISDVTCDSHYSGVEPSTNGEVIFRVLPPHIHIDNPHSPDVQNLLKMTNLRINFTRLHTLGDNLLDSRREIKQKYYYAVYDMVVRGSCSCYGHASRCIPEEGENYGTARDDMVFGKCQCTHNTKGLNCESCEELYNDQPWRPASERDPNPCKRCNCNDHANKCHFDAAVWERSGRVSGGVCDDCQDNTMGVNCEQCVPFYYKDPQRDITDPHVCQPCDCDPRGSLDDGVCDPQDDPASGLVAGRCHCKKNVESRRCDRCKKGYFNFQAANPDGCEPCSCHELGTAGDGCNVYTGECTCKRNVIGRDCNQCLPEYWGLGRDDDGCKPCDCDPGGAYENSCDVITGQCRCRPSVQGRRCDQPETGYFVGNLDYMVYEAELAKASPDCQVLVREPYAEREPTWTGLGFMQIHQDSYLEFDVPDVPTSMDYNIVFRYEPKLPHGWEEAIVTVDRPGPVDPKGPCANIIPQDDRQVIRFSSGERHVIVAPAVCLEKGKHYKVRITFKQYDQDVDTPSASILIDSMVLMPDINAIPFFHGTPVNKYRREEFERFRCGQGFYDTRKGGPLPEVCKKYLYSIGFYVFQGAQDCRCDPQGSHSSVCVTLGGQCQCKANVVGRNCDRCAPGTYGFGPGGCRPCDCNGIGSLDNFCDAQTGQCKCRPNTYGRQCDECQPGYWNYPNCQRCDCHGHADTCDSRTGHCIQCRDFTAGPHCDRCETGFYGDPRYGVDIPCRPCPCPGTVDSGVNHATSCDLDPRTGNVMCHCAPGYVGERCDRCANNYYGEPNVPGGSCRRCECSGNVDETQPGNCDSRTGVCLRCLYNTEGPHCERCKPGHYGDASRQQCLECVCNLLGLDQSQGYCDPVTGQCPCLPNVEGKSCDRCAPNYWKIASGEGCEACDCDPLGSYEPKCNEFDGQCPCKPGHGGRQCNQCQDLHWGDPRVRCYPCECNVPGAATTQCQRNNGSCVCIDGVAGERCEQCARGFTGRAPYCKSCGECFDNWDRIIRELREETQNMINSARQIKQQGTTGVYTREFQEMEERLHEVEEILSGANITGLDLMDRQSLIEEIRRNLTESQMQLEEIGDRSANVTQRSFDVNLKLVALHERAQKLGKDAKALRENTTALQEANVEGALNITREAQKRSQQASGRVQGAQEDIQKSSTMRRLTERMLESAASRYNATYLENENALRKLQQEVADLEDQISDVNELVCFKRGTVDRCDPICGGAGCNHCGGLGCDEGAVTGANTTLTMAVDANQILVDKEAEARQLFGAVGSAEKESQRALEEAKRAFERSQMAKNQSEDVTTDLQDLLDRIDKFLSGARARPAEIRVLAEECIALSISLEPEQIRELAREINDTIASLTDIDAILRETGPDLSLAKDLKARADLARTKANKILDTAKEVLQNLDDAAEAQGKAKQAIDQAREHINTAEEDLAQIEDAAYKAQGVANRSLDEVGGLQDRLAELKKKYTQNNLDARKAVVEAKGADRLAGQAHNEAEDLEAEYTRVAAELGGKSTASGDMKDRAEKLRERARKLAESVNSKTQLLQGMEDEFDENEKRLTDYSEILEMLNREMTGYLEHIDKRSTYYRQCQN
ncbi:laminin subunit beta-1 isoform X2 [Haemaphysalis longicornis]